MRQVVTLSKTGNDELDEQLSLMQDCLSDLASLLDGASSPDPAKLHGSLEALYSYAEWHFTFEERMLERSKYPNRLEHIAEHRAIMSQLDNLRRKLAAGNQDAARLISVISHWIVDHVDSEDIKSANYLENNKVGAIHPSRMLTAVPL